MSSAREIKKRAELISREFCLSNRCIRESHAACALKTLIEKALKEEREMALKEAAEIAEKDRRKYVDECNCPNAILSLMDNK